MGHRAEVPYHDSDPAGGNDAHRRNDAPLGDVHPQDRLLRLRRGGGSKAHEAAGSQTENGEHDNQVSARHVLSMNHHGALRPSRKSGNSV